jgi:hypothetical protein
MAGINADFLEIFEINEKVVKKLGGDVLENTPRHSP